MIISVAKFLLDPFNILWLLAFCSALAWYWDKTKLCRWLAGILAVLFLIVSTPLVPVLVLNSLEKQYEPVYVNALANPEAAYHIIVLGGGHGFDDRLPPNSLLSKKALGRLIEAVRLHRLLPNSTLVLSGFSASGGTTQAEMLQQTAILLGIQKEATLLQNVPANTYEEAMVYARNYGNSHPVILVTNAAHMPRAVKMFEKFGINPYSSPTNYRLKGSWKDKRIGLPSLKYMEILRTGVNEYAGMFWYSM